MGGYGRALHRAMAAVLEDVAEAARQQALETANYSISVGLTIGLERPGGARRLLELIEAAEPERDALNAVAADFLEEVFACEPPRSRLHPVSDSPPRE